MTPCCGAAAGGDGVTAGDADAAASAVDSSAAPGVPERGGFAEAMAAATYPIAGRSTAGGAAAGLTTGSGSSMSDLLASAGCGAAVAGETAGAAATAAAATTAAAPAVAAAAPAAGTAAVTEPGARTDEASEPARDSRRDLVRDDDTSGERMRRWISRDDILASSCEWG